MSKINLSVEIDPQYNRKSKPNKKDSYPVNIVLRKGTKKAYIIPDLPNIPLNSFKKGEGNWVQKDFPNSKRYNIILSQILNSLNLYLLDNYSQSLTPKDLKEWYLKNHTKAGTFEDFKNEKFSDYLDQFKKRKNRSTFNIYTHAQSKMNAFKPNASFADFDRKFVLKFADYLQKDAGLSGSSAREYFNKVKATYTHWYEENFPDDPEGYRRLFNRVSFKSAPVNENKSLTQSQFDAIASLKLKKGSQIRLVRDVFLFLCFTSRYLIEVLAISFEKNVSIDPLDKSKIHIRGIRAKSNIRFQNIVFPGLHREILEEYHPTKTGMFFPQLVLAPSNPNQHFNYYLKQIGELAKVDFKPTVRTGKVTFNTLIAKNFDPNTKAVMMGHGNTLTQQKYNATNLDLYSRI